MRRCAHCKNRVSESGRACAECAGRARASASADSPRSEIEQHLRGPRCLLPAALAGRIGDRQPAISGERRDITLLFVELGAAGSADQDLLRDRAMHRLVKVVQSYDGMVERFTNDGLIAIFGVPSVHENDPERALRAAIDMLTQIGWSADPERDTSAGSISARIGVHCDTIVQTSIGDDLCSSYTALDSLAAALATLRTAALPGHVTVSETTYQRTRRIFAYEPYQGQPTAGQQPVPLFRLQIARALRGSGRGVEGLQAPMVARETALNQLVSSLDQMRRQHRATTVWISGEAGIGKSRLLEEFMQLIRAEDVRIYQFTCVAHTQSRPLWVAAGLLRQIMRIDERADSSAQYRALHSYLGGINLVRDEIVTYLAHVLGIAQADPPLEHRLRFLDPAALQRQTHAALHQVLRAEGLRQPIVLMLDDGQWLDQPSLSFVEYLLQTAGEAPIMLVLSLREHPADRERLARVVRESGWSVSHIPLTALSESEGSLLVERLLGSIADSLVPLRRQIVSRAQGNPLYIEEIVQALIDQGRLVKSGQRWSATEHTDLLQHVPTTIQDLLLTRFDRLPEATRRTLQTAAVLGVSFALRMLEALDLAGSRTRTHLNTLQHERLICQIAGDGPPSYRFRHVLIQETAYHTLLERDRRMLHTRAAHTIEELDLWSGEERLNALAYHYGNSDTPTSAIPFLLAAADTASRRYANDAAISQYRRALALLDTPTEQASAQRRQAMIGLGKALRFTGSFVEAGLVLQEAIREHGDRCHASDPDWLLIDALLELAEVRHREGALDDAISVLSQGLDALGEAGRQHQPSRWLALMERMAFVRFRQSRLDEASSLATTAIAASTALEARDAATLASLYNTLGGIAWQQGHAGQAAVYVEQSLRVYESFGYAWGVANAYSNLGVLLYTQGRWAQAAESFERSDELRREIGYMPGRAINIRNLGTLRMSMGDYASAREHLQISRSISLQLGAEYEVAGAELGLAQLAILEARFSDAATHLAAVRRLADAVGEEELVMSGWIEALIIAESGPIARAIEIADHTLQMAQAAGLIEQVVEVLRVLGRLLLRAGQYAAAEIQLIASQNQARLQADRYQEALSLLELGRLHTRWADADPSLHSQHQRSAHTVLDRAAHTFDDLGAARDRAEVDELRRKLAYAPTSIPHVRMQQAIPCPTPPLQKKPFV